MPINYPPVHVRRAPFFFEDDLPGYRLLMIVGAVPSLELAKIRLLPELCVAPEIAVEFESMTESDNRTVPEETTPVELNETNDVLTWIVAPGSASTPAVVFAVNTEFLTMTRPPVPTARPNVLLADVTLSKVAPMIPPAGAMTMPTPPLLTKLLLLIVSVPGPAR